MSNKFSIPCLVSFVSANRKRYIVTSLHCYIVEPSFLADAFGVEAR